MPDRGPLPTLPGDDYTPRFGPLAFTVYGTPQPAGSKTSGQRGDGTRFVRDSAKRSAPWKREVAQAAGAVVNGGGLIDAPLALNVVFYVPRPKGHFGARGLRPSAPVYPTTRPDVTKLLRAVEDACTGVVWRDDSQIVIQSAEKRYGEPARCVVSVSVIA